MYITNTSKSTDTYLYFRQEFSGVSSSNICGDEGKCVNLEGSFDCECPSGFVFAGEIKQKSNQADPDSNKGCIDIDECSLYFNPCGQGKGVCLNKVCIIISDLTFNN